MLKHLFILLSLFLSKASISQTFILSGKITSGNEALAFATILVKGGSYGTSSNSEGHYALKLAAGNYEIIFQHIGYAKRIEKIDMRSDKTLNIVLKSEGISLGEVVIKADEDPANPIIRKAIKKREHYQNQTALYSCKAYMKGFQKIISLPKNIQSLIKLSNAELTDTSDLKGVVYLSESESKYYYRRPNDEREIMYSSKVSGNNRAFSFNRLGGLKINFYNNLVELGGLSTRSFVSPLNENAFSFYRFFLLGKINEDGRTVNKIKVVPKNTSDPCYRGVIYIQDSTWRITGVDVILTKETKINFVDTLHIKQVHAAVSGDSIWMPVSLNLAFDFNVFGFKGDGYFNAGIKEYDLNPDIPNGFFNNEVLKVEEEANKKDSAYWNAHRSIPLTTEEIKDYRKKDSIGVLRDSDRFKDSVDKKRNKLNLNHVLLGYNYHNTKKKLIVSIPGLITYGVQYNTVEGLNLSYYFSIKKTHEKNRDLEIAGQTRYGFSNQLWGGALGFNYQMKPEKFSGLSLRFKSLVQQYNPDEPIPAFVNTCYSLFLNDNFMKLFKESGVETKFHRELVNGLYFSTTVKYMQRDPLKNTSDILFIDDKDKLFTGNDPRYENSEDFLFKSNQAFTAELTFSYHFKQKYISHPYEKIVIGSKYPKLQFTYKKAFPVAGAIADYDLVNFSVGDEIRLGLPGKFSFNVKTGWFINSRQMYFMDFKHFTGNQTVISTKDFLNSFRLLPYYRYSTNSWYLEGHSEHHFNGYIFTKIPLIKKLKAQEIIGVHFLTNNILKYYAEFNFGVERILNVLRIDYILGYGPDNTLRHGVVFGLGLSF